MGFKGGIHRKREKESKVTVNRPCIVNPPFSYAGASICALSIVHTPPILEMETYFAIRLDVRRRKRESDLEWNFWGAINLPKHEFTDVIWHVRTMKSNV